MWYGNSKIVVAGLEDAIANLAANGVSEQILEYVRSSDQTHQGILINHLMKKPQSSWDELSNIIQNITERANSAFNQPTPFEQRIIKYFNPAFQAWPFVYLKKIRGNQIDKNNFNYQWFDGVAAEEKLWNIQNTFKQIADWSDYVLRENPYFQLATYDFSQAHKKSNEWHNFMAGQGNEEYYTPYKRDESGNVIDERVVYVYPDGWHISQLLNKNDLTVEGNRMNHCVGSYCEDVANGSTRIFSLRDQRNSPKVTIEMKANSNQIVQIKAHSDARPEQALRLRLAKWFESLEDGASFYGDDEAWEGPSWDSDPEGLASSIYQEAYGADEDDMGVSGDYHSDYGLSEPDFSRSIEHLDVPDLLENVEEHISEAYRRIDEHPQWYRADRITNALTDVITTHDVAIMRLMLENPQNPVNWHRRLFDAEIGKYNPIHVRNALGVFDIAEGYNDAYESVVQNMDEGAESLPHKELIGEDDKFRLYYETLSDISEKITPEMEDLYRKITGGSLRKDLDLTTFGEFGNIYSKRLNEMNQPLLMKHKEDVSNGYGLPFGSDPAFDKNGWSYAKKFHGWYRLARV